MLENSVSPSVFTKKAYEAISKLDSWDDIYSEIRDIFNPNSQPKSIKVLNQEFRANTINKFIEKNRHIIMLEVSKECL